MTINSLGICHPWKDVPENATKGNSGAGSMLLLHRLLFRASSRSGMTRWNFQQLFWESCMSTIPSSLELSGKRQWKYCIISSKCVLKSSKPSCHSLNLRKPGTLSLTTDAHNAPRVVKVLKSSTTQKVLVLKWTQIIHYIFFPVSLKSTNWNSFQSMRPAS